MKMFTVNVSPVSGVVSASGTHWELWCADDGGYWWIPLAGGVAFYPVGPVGLSEPDAMRALDLAFDTFLP